MASRLKEDEKNERVIRGLLKLQPNRRCINCNSLGPQYVCTNFWTFVCTNCSGIHREFTHRVKSVSMAKFTSQEVSALQEGGNQRAKEIYFKEWDAQRHSFPDSSNVDRLRDFIKHVYVDRRFTGEKPSDKPPRVKAGDKDDFYQGGSKSPSYEDAYERRYGDRSSPGGRSPGYDQESRRYGDNKRSPGRPPIINDWSREDRRMSDGDYKVGSRSPEQAKELGSSSPPVRPVREILGENVVPLRISEPPKPNSGRTADGSAVTQRTASSSSLASNNENPVDVKMETTKSLIDFDADPEPPVAPSVPQAQQTSAPQPVVQPANSSDNNWASFDVAPDAKVTSSSSNLNPLESVLSELSMPASLPAHASGMQGPIPASSLTSTSATPSLGGFSAFPPSGASVPFFPAAISQSSSQQFTPPVGGPVNNQPWHVPSLPTVQGHSSAQIPHTYQHTHRDAPKPANEAISTVVSQPSAVEVKASGRRELPEDLFTVKYPSYPAPALGWQMNVPHGMGISMQYNNMVPMPSFPQPSKSMNPFDVGSESTPDQAPTFPSMSSLQGALPSVPPPGSMRPSINPSHAWTPPPSSSPFVSALPAQAQAQASAWGPRAYMGQQMPTSMPMPRQEVGNFGTQGAVYGLSNPEQQLSGRLSSTPTYNSLPTGGNPFG